MSELIRLNRFLSLAHIASRRQADLLIAAGEVLVNGQVVSDLGSKVDPGKDVVRVQGKRLRPPGAYRYVLFHKPRGCLCTQKDPFGRRTIYDLLPASFRDLKYAGRLDGDSEGLLLLTDDGDLIQQLTHPRNQVPRTYLVEVEGVPNRGELEHLARGFELDGERLQPVRARVVRVDREGNHALLQAVTLEGRKREVRRICEALGHPVLRLTRIGFGNLRLEGLPPGEWKIMPAREARAACAAPTRQQGSVTSSNVKKSRSPCPRVPHA